MSDANSDWGWRIEYPEGYTPYNNVTHVSWRNAYYSVKCHVQPDDVIFVQLDEQSPLQEIDEVLELMMALKYGV